MKFEQKLNNQGGKHLLQRVDDRLIQILILERNKLGISQFFQSKSPFLQVSLTTKVFNSDNKLVHNKLSYYISLEDNLLYNLNLELKSTRFDVKDYLFTTTSRNSESISGAETFGQTNTLSSSLNTYGIPVYATIYIQLQAFQTLTILEYQHIGELLVSFVLLSGVQIDLDTSVFIWKDKKLRMKVEHQLTLNNLLYEISRMQLFLRSMYPLKDLQQSHNLGIKFRITTSYYLQSEDEAALNDDDIDCLPLDARNRYNFKEASIIQAYFTNICPSSP